MKKKFIILTLCFTLIFTSINYKKSYAFDLVMTPTLLAITATLAVGTGVAIKNSDGLYDVAKGMVNFLGVNKIKEMNKQMLTAGYIALNGLITIPKKVSNPIKSYFDEVIKPTKNNLVNLGTLGGISSVYTPYYEQVDDWYTKEYSFGDYRMTFGTWASQNLPLGLIYYKNNLIKEVKFGGTNYGNLSIHTLGNEVRFSYEYYYPSGDIRRDYISLGSLATVGDVGLSLPYVPGSYDWDKTFPDTSEGDIGIYIPGNVGDLVTNPPGDITNPYPGVLTPGGTITVPDVSNPSIDLDIDITIPGDIVTEGCPDCGLVGEHAPTCPSLPVNPPIDPPIGGIIPPFPSFGDSLDFSPMYLTNVTEKFPFSLPWDLGRVLNMLDVPSKAPIFEIPFLTETVRWDLTMFDDIANIFRFFILIGFIITLIFISTRLLG